MGGARAGAQRGGAAQAQGGGGRGAASARGAQGERREAGQRAGGERRDWARGRSWGAGRGGSAHDREGVMAIGGAAPSSRSGAHPQGPWRGPVRALIACQSASLRPARCVSLRPFPLLSSPLPPLPCLPPLPSLPQVCTFPHMPYPTSSPPPQSLGLLLPPFFLLLRTCLLSFALLPL